MNNDDISTQLSKLNKEDKYRSKAFKNGDLGDRRVVEELMRLKLRDEVAYNRELNQEKTMWRKQIGEYSSNKRQYLRMIKELMIAAQRVKSEHSGRFMKKVEFFEEKVFRR